MPTLNISVPDELHRRIKVEAARRGETLKAFVLTALASALVPVPEKRSGAKRG